MKTLYAIIFLSILCVATVSAQRAGRHVIASSEQSLSFLAFSHERFMAEDATLQVSLESNLPLSVMEKMKFSSRWTDVSHLLEVYSNPLLRKVIIRSELLAEENKVSIFDNNGVELNLPIVFGQDLQLDFDRQPIGVFYLVIRNSSQKSVAKFKVVKNN